MERGRADEVLCSQDDTDTEDDLPLNSAVVFDVNQGNIELVPMPQIP